MGLLFVCHYIQYNVRLHQAIKMPDLHYSKG